MSYESNDSGNENEGSSVSKDAYSNVVSLQTKKFKAPKNDYQLGASQTMPWLSMSKKEMAKPGASLIALLMRQASENEHGQEEMCAQIGITSDYFVQIRSSDHPFSQIEEEVVVGIARYMDTSKVAVKVLAEVLKLEDFCRRYGI